MEFLEIVGQVAAQFVNAWNNQLPVSAVFQPGVFADFLVIFMSGKVHPKDGVVVIGAGEFRRGVGDQHLDEFVDIDAASADDLDAYALRHVAWLHCL
jgi:hypothetical protein